MLKKIMKKNAHKHSVLRRLIPAVLFLSGLTACGGGGNDTATTPPPASGGNPCGPPSGTSLRNGCLLSGVDGVAIRALSDSLSAPLQVTLSVASVPAESLPANTQPAGNHYELRAERNQPVSTDSPFILSFPVPLATDTAHLALAMRVPLASTLHTPRAGWGWLLLDGQYDAAQQTFLTTLPFLAEDGRIVVLVTHPDFESPPAAPVAAPTTTRTTAATAARGAARGVIHLSDDFYIDCIDLPAVACPDSLKTDMRDVLTRARAELRKMGFLEARLRAKISDIGLSSGEVFGLGWLVRVVPITHANCTDSQGDPAAGMYLPNEAVIYICLDGADASGGMPGATAKVLVHEYFHATQYAYPAVHDNWLNGVSETWLLEGTATAAENSYIQEVGPGVQKMFRSPDYPLRSIEVELRASDQQPGYEHEQFEYQTQDFWVYAGLRFDQDMDSLITMLITGASIDAIDVTLFGDQLKSMYWAWVKNQAFEKAVDFNGTLTNPCTLQVSVVAPNGTDYGTQWPWFPIRIPTPLTGSIKPLATTLVRLEHNDGYESEMTIREIYSQFDPDLVYKIYLDGERVCDATWPDGSRTFSLADGNLDPNRRYYVLISNLSFTEEKTYRLEGEAK